MIFKTNTDLFILLVPIAVFAYQSIRNSLFGWIAVMAIYLIFLVFWIIGLIEAYDLVGAKHDINQYLSWWTYVFIYLVIGFLYLKILPREKTI
jgi:hypothetical protein